ncbi:hypothetical protein P9X10_01340 [Bacillus cereus]|nr:hypothetical protein [Bacillus cereus]
MRQDGIIIETYHTQKDFEYTLQGAMVYADGELIYHCTDIQTFRSFLAVFELDLYSPTESETDGEGIINKYRVLKDFKIEPYTSLHETPDELTMVEVVLNGKLYVGYVHVDERGITLFYPDFETDNNLYKMTFELSKSRRKLSSNLIFHINQ